MARLLKTQWVVIGLFVLAIATRLPYQSRTLYEHDAVNFAWAMEDFDLERHQPHPPGTFIILIWSARLLNLWHHDANQSLVAVNIIAMAIATVALYHLGNLWFNPSVALMAAFIMLSSPLTWFYSEVGLSYTPELAWVVLLAIACHHTRFGDRRALLISSLLLGLAGGIRPNTPIFLFPLWAIALTLGGRDYGYRLKHLLLAFLSVALGCALWVIPLLEESGGWQTYQRAIHLWLNSHLKDTDSFRELFSNLWLWISTLLMSLGFITLPLLWWVHRFPIRNLPWRDWRCQAIALWSFPSILYLTFVHFQRQGHSTTILPVIFLVTALALHTRIKHSTLSAQKAKLWITGFVLCNTLLFIGGPAQWRTWTRIHEYDRFVKERITVIEQTFSPAHTAVLSTGNYARLVSYYFRNYYAADLGLILTEDFAFLDPRVNTLILFDGETLAHATSELPIQTLPLPPNDRLRYVQWSPPQQVQVSQTAIRMNNEQ